MNSPLEFRAWHTPTQKMYYDIQFWDDDVHLPWDDDKSDADNYRVVDHPLKRSDCVIMQFTGILDCNGVKIWEKDILFSECMCEDEQGQERLMKWYYEVVYMKGTFVTINQKGWYDPIIDLKCSNPAEQATERVVGNRLQHNHLLEMNGDFDVTQQLPSLV